MIESETRQAWSSYLQRAMHSAGIATDAQLAARSGISQSVISRWHKGKTTPTRESLRKLAEPLGVPFIDLLVASGQATAHEVGMRRRPQPPARAPGAGIDPELLTEVEELSEAQLQRVRDFVRGLRGA